MPQSLSAVYIHLIFSTKERRPFLRDKATRSALHAYLGGISKQRTIRATSTRCAPGWIEDRFPLADPEFAC